jgi:hypothetical protein
LIGIGDELAGDCVCEPEAPLLVPREALGPRPHGLDIRPADAAMGSGRDERQVPSVAEVYHMLA